MVTASSTKDPDQREGKVDSRAEDLGETSRARLDLAESADRTAEAEHCGARVRIVERQTFKLTISRRLERGDVLKRFVNLSLGSLSILRLQTSYLA